MDEDDRLLRLEDGELLAYVDGSLDEPARRRVEQRLSQDPALRAEAEQLDAFQAQLAGRLRHGQAPTVHELGEYVLRLLPSEQMQAVELQVSASPYIRAEVEQLQEYLQGLAPELEFDPATVPSPAAAAVQQVRVVIAELLDTLAGGWSSALAPAFGGLRGGTEGVALVFGAGDAQILIDVQDDLAAPGQRSVLGLIIGVTTPTALQATLYQAGSLVAATEVDAAGNFVLAGVQPGIHDLILSGADLEIQLRQVIV